MIDLDLLREWIRAEIDYAIAQQEVGADGYTSACHYEKEIANNLFNKINREEESYEHKSQTKSNQELMTEEMDFWNGDG